MLTRDKLTVVDWHALRNTPHHIVIAVSAVGGSVLDALEVLPAARGIH